MALMMVNLAHQDHCRHKKKIGQPEGQIRQLVEMARNPIRQLVGMARNPIRQLVGMVRNSIRQQAAERLCRSFRLLISWAVVAHRLHVPDRVFT
jgi:hypothetical protein